VLQLRAARPIYVYVIDEDDLGNRTLLFPATDLDQPNPIPGGLGFRLPGIKNRRDSAWRIDGKGHRESIFLVASLAPLGKIEALASSGPRPELSQATIREMVRGISEPVAVGEVIDGKEILSRLVDELERLAKSGAPSKSIWIRKFTLLKS
jgi:hypothetical protein